MGQIEDPNKVMIEAREPLGRPFGCLPGPRPAPIGAAQRGKRLHGARSHRPLLRRSRLRAERGEAPRKRDPALRWELYVMWLYLLLYLYSDIYSIYNHVYVSI